MSWGDDVIELEAPATAAVSLEDLAAHLRLGEGFSSEAEDVSALEGLARAASAAVEASTGKALIRRRFKWTVLRWRDPVFAPFPVAPVPQVHAVTLVDSDGAWSTADPTAWVLRSDALRPCLVGPGGGDLPGIPRDGSAEIEFTAGYGDDPSGVPEALRHAVRLLAAHYHEQRHAAGGRLREIPHGVESLISPFRQVRL
ncbi:MAG: hypothetical protein AAF763_00365 [Pseudomonadota bacterium]